MSISYPLLMLPREVPASDGSESHWSKGIDSFLCQELRQSWPRRYCSASGKGVVQMGYPKMPC